MWERTLSQKSVRLFCEQKVIDSQKLIFFLSKITCAFAMAIAVLSVNSTCCFTAYQPDVPESLDRN